MNEIRNISDNEWKIIKNAKDEVYIALALQVSHMLARLMLDFQRKGLCEIGHPANIAEDLDTLMLTAINVFRRGEREEVSDFYDCADRLSAVALKLETCGKMIQDFISIINEVRPENFAVPDLRFDDNEWEVFDANKPNEEESLLDNDS
jgi:hypothetical protein